MSVQLSAPAGLPAGFRRAVAGLTGVELRPEVVVSELPPPQRLAPHARVNKTGQQALNCGSHGVQLPVAPVAVLASESVESLPISRGLNRLPDGAMNWTE